MPCPWRSGATASGDSCEMNRSEPASWSAVKLIIALNVAWVAGSIGLLMSGTVTPTVLGYAFVIVQAVVVGVFAELQFIGLRREQTAPA